MVLSAKLEDRLVIALYCDGYDVVCNNYNTRAVCDTFASFLDYNGTTSCMYDIVAL